MEPTTATAGVVLLLLALGGAGKKKKRRVQPQPEPQPEPPPESCTIEPFVYNEAEIEMMISAAISAGMRSRDRIAIWVAGTLWPVYPGTNQAISWPPDLSDTVGVVESAEVICLWYKLLDHIDDYLDENGIPPWPPCEPGTHFDPVQEICAEDIRPKPKPFDIDDWESKGDYPMPGTFVQIRYGDRLLGTFSPENVGGDEEGEVLRSIIYTTLLSAGWMAAKEIGGLDDDAAAQFARDVAYDDANRIEFLHLIQCSPYNDAAYATYGFSTKSWESPSGRALRFLPQHYDNRGRLSAGRAAARNISLGSVADKGSGGGLGEDPSGRSFAFLWLPHLDLVALWESGGTILTTVNWEDGSSGIMPPPEITALGIDNVPNILWGCLGYESSIEPQPPGGGAPSIHGTPVVPPDDENDLSGFGYGRQAY